ncbi:MAG TPA: ABC transporter permease [Thermoanaerobaculia bacterium]|nr:ABC transporter permease [Thermoanaerobaculia bacterium]
MKQAVLAAAAALIVLALVATLAGYSPLDVMATIVRGSIGSTFALGSTLIKMVPLLLTGLSVVVAFRAGVWNIGAEGQFIVGGLAAFMASPFGAVPALLAAVLAGAAWASIATALRLWRGAPEVLTTILLNFVGLYLLGWCVNGPLRERSGRYPQTDLATSALPEGSGAIIALAVAAGIWWLLYRTAEGLRLRAAGFNPDAARYARINVAAQLARAMAVSGAIAGLAGGIELLSVTHRLFERFASGYGYVGIAVALLAQLHPLAAIASAAFFGILSTGSGELQRSAGMSASIATFAQAVVILVLIAFTAIDERRRRGSLV